MIALCEKPKYHSRSKHVATQYYFIQGRMYVTNEFSWVVTLDMIIDVVTKS
jgi:hypothetical protein